MGSGVGIGGGNFRAIVFYPYERRAYPYKRSYFRTLHPQTAPYNTPSPIYPYTFFIYPYTFLKYPCEKIFYLYAFQKYRYLHRFCAKIKGVGHEIRLPHPNIIIPGATPALLRFASPFSLGVRQIKSQYLS